MSQAKAYKVENRSLPVAVVEAIASFADRNPIVTDKNGEDSGLQPLYETIDPDALDSLFQTSQRGPSTEGKIKFVHCGYEVTVKNSGMILVKES